MTTTTNYGYNVVEGTDQVNIQTQIAPNFTAIDTDLKTVSDAAITTATHTVAGTVHQLVRDDSDRAVLRFVATGDFATGDTFTVDGLTVTARLVNGEALQTGSFRINNCVEAVLVGTVLNVNAINPTVSDAGDVTYDNTGSGLTATNVQDAIDEVKSDIPTIPSGYAASAITYNNTLSGLTATDVQFAIDELASAISSPGSVRVVADGVKTTGQILNQLFGLMDTTKITAKSAFQGGTAYGHLAATDGLTLWTFASTKIQNNTVTTYTWNLSSTSGFYRAITSSNSTAFTDYTTSVQPVGTIFELTY